MGRRSFVGLAALLALGACQGKQRTMLVVEIDSNLVVPGALDKVDVAITVNGETPHTPYSLINDYKLPLHVGVVKASDGAGNITIVASGYKGPTFVVSETAIVGFVEGKSMLLKLFLARECIGKTCPNSNQTCTTGGNCRDQVRKPNELTPFTPSDLVDAAPPREDARRTYDIGISDGTVRGGDATDVKLDVPYTADSFGDVRLVGNDTSTDGSGGAAGTGGTTGMDAGGAGSSDAPVATGGTSVTDGSVATGGAGGIGGGSGSSGDAGVRDTPRVQPDVPRGGSGGGLGGIGGAGGNGGAMTSFTGGTTSSAGGTIVSLGGTTSSAGGSGGTGGNGGAGVGGTGAAGTPAGGGGGTSTTGTGGAGGTGTGGAATGGTATGGTGTGGAATGGAATGGTATGGAGGTGGTGTGGATEPVIISIDFVGGSPNGAAGASGTVAMEPSESAGVEPVTATHWNSAFGSTGNNLPLMSASGSSTTAFASWSVNAIDGAIDTWSNFFADAAGDTRMMNGYLDPRAVNYNATISVTGLPDTMSGGYDVYVYFYSYMPAVETRLYQYNIGATTYFVTQTGPFAGACPAYRLASDGDAGAAGEGNYVVFHNLNGDHFTLTALPAQNSLGQQRAPVNGIQIVYPSGS